MDCKDLMVGDLVYIHEPECKGHRIDAIDELDGQVGADGEVYDECDIRPIPLNEEILVKNGFVKAYTKVHGIMADENLWFCHIGADYIELRLEGNVAIWKDYDKKADGLYSDYLFPLPTSVHQLQHLLCICGVEKKIEI